MEELQELKSRMEQERPAQWEELPNLALYMDQIISYMSRQHLNIHLPHQVLPQVCRGVGEDGEIISLGHLWMHSFP